MNTAIQSFVRRPTGALQNLWNRLNTPPKYRVSYESKMSTPVNGNKTLGKTTTDHESVEEGLNQLRQNLEEIFQAWLSVDRGKNMAIQIDFSSSGSDANQCLTINLPAPASFQPEVTN